MQPGPAVRRPPPVGPPDDERPNPGSRRGPAKVQALDKVTAQSASLTIKVGGERDVRLADHHRQSLHVRPTDQPADAAAYLTVTDSLPGSPSFAGWMLENEPSVSMMEHPIYDLRVPGCA